MYCVHQPSHLGREALNQGVSCPVQVESLHQLLGVVRTSFLAERRRRGDDSDPFVEADRREAAKQEAAAKRMHPTLNASHVVQPAPQFPAMPAGVAPPLFGVNTPSTTMSTFSSASAPGSLNPGAFTSSASLFTTPAPPAQTSSLFGGLGQSLFPAFGASPSTPAPASTPFGSTTPSIFGATTPVFGTSPSLFGSTAPPLGTPSTTPFGGIPSSPFSLLIASVVVFRSVLWWSIYHGGVLSQLCSLCAASATGSVFGASPLPASTPSPFGATPGGGGLFGAGASPGLFGATPPTMGTLMVPVWCSLATLLPLSHSLCVLVSRKH